MGKPNGKERLSKPAFHYLNKLYFFAFFAIGVTIVVSQVMVQRHLDEQNNDSRVVNIAGRQRMLSQRITKICLQLHQDKDSALMNVHLDALSKSLALFESSHASLRNQEETDELSGSPNSPELEMMFQSIAPFYDGLVTAGHYFNNKGAFSDSALVVEKLKLLSESESRFLPLMDNIVFQYDKEAKSRVDELKSTSLRLLFIALVVLIFEVLFIFLPEAKKIRNAIYELRISEFKAKALALQLKKTNASLEKSTNELKDVTFALNEATIIAKTDLNGIVTYVNEKFCEVSKYPPEEWIGKKMDIINDSGEEEDLYPTIQKLLNKPQDVWNGEIRKIAKDDGEFWLDVTFIPIISENGSIYQYMAICNDITLRKFAEEELERLNKENFEREFEAQKIRAFSIIDGQENERKRMAMEIHDGVGQMLTALKFSIQSIEGKDEKELERLAGIRGLLYDTIKEVRRISSDLLPNVLSDFGVNAAIRELLGSIDKTIDINLVYNDQLTLTGRLNKAVETSLFRIAQESINNALKYPEAVNIKITLSNDAEFVTLSVIDDGKGFDLDKAYGKHSGRYVGNGLTSMTERASLINGKLYINTSPGKGTNIYAEVPLNNDNYEPAN